ncbi:DUF2851 family protein [bacterium]|nr:DUF2851 family protein [bacterium]
MTPLHPAESYWDWRERLKHMMAGTPPGVTAESGSDYLVNTGVAPLNEKLIQTIWAQQLLQTSGLRLADGRPLRILDPGRPSGDGPDFKGARLIIGERAVDGDVEIHIDASGWQAHGHHRDLDYNTVVLHVVLKIDDGAKDDVAHNGMKIPRLELEKYVFPDLDTLRRSISADDFPYEEPAETGRCQRVLAGMDSMALADFLDRAGDERLVAKMQRLQEQAAHADLEQVFYQALMMSLGGAGSAKTLYYLLAKRTPLSEVLDFAAELDEQDRATGIEALLLAVAGLLPNTLEMIDAPPESVERRDKLATLWTKWESYWCDRLIPLSRRWMQGTRPVNFPTRRLAGVAVLLARALNRNERVNKSNVASSRSDLLTQLIERIKAGEGALQSPVRRKKIHPVVEDLVNWFRVRGEGHFWGTHYSFTAKPAGRTMDLIGEGAALSLVLNALAPAALLAARRSSDQTLEAAVCRLYALVPPLQQNHITEFMSKRLFGDSEWAKGIINTERRRQALHQIFYTCCNAEERHCDQCYFRA